MTIKDCPNCGGTHYGSYKFPFIKEPCVVCGVATVFACSDCAINCRGAESTHVCEKSECRDVHERACHPAKSPTPPAPGTDVVDKELRRDARYGHLTIGGLLDKLDEQHDEIDSLRSQLSKAKEALKPFAELLDESFQQYVGDPDKIEVGNFATIKLSDLRRAHSLMEERG